MLAGGQSRRIAWGGVRDTWCGDVCRSLTMAVLRQEVSLALPLSAGVTIYVAASDLIPEVNREPGAKVALVVFLGVALFFALEHLVH